MPIELLLLDAHTQRPIIDRQIADEALPPAPESIPSAAPLKPPDEDPSTRPALHRWTLVHADSERGWRARDLLAPLIEHRRAQCRVRTLPLSAQVTCFGSWCREHGIGDDPQRPEHILIVGDLPDVSLHAQYELAERAYVGRLCFSHTDGRLDPDGYRQYCDKVLAAENRPQSPNYRSLFYCSRGDPVSEQAYGNVVRRSWKKAEEREFAHRFTTWSELAEFEQGIDEPSVLFSMCHGAYEPDPDQQTARQGALALQESVGADIEMLFAPDFAGKRFLDRGFWFMMTCYSAATPAESVYAPWLAHLTSVVASDDIEQAQASLAVNQPFVARIPQVVLANPEGPLGVLGHADMTWSMGYNDHRLNARTGEVQTVVGAAYSAYAQVVNAVADGAYFGTAARALLEFPDEPDPIPDADEQVERTLRALRYMRYLDRRCYILLGDPAARLPLAPEPLPE